jgi:hypothetical protein
VLGDFESSTLQSNATPFVTHSLFVTLDSTGVRAIQQPLHPSDIGKLGVVHTIK